MRRLMNKLHARFLNNVILVIICGQKFPPFSIVVTIVTSQKFIGIIEIQ